MATIENFVPDGIDDYAGVERLHRVEQFSWRIHCNTMNEFPTQEMYAIEVPGIIQHDNLLIEMLGGASEVSKVFQSGKRRLALHFRPNMVFCKPTFGEPMKTVSLALQVQRLRHREDGQEKFRTTIVCRVPVVYKFLNMADFQFGPFERRLERNSSAPSSRCNDKYRVFYNDVVIREPTTFLDPYFLLDTPLYVPPLYFLRYDAPLSYNFTSRYRSSEYIEMEEKSQQFAIARKPRHGYVFIVGFEEPTPTAPNDLTTERMLSCIPMSDVLTNQFNKLFNERPIWIRSAIMYHTKTLRATTAFKLSLFSHAYFMAHGPWGRSWIRFGYDPRKDPDARYYQVIDFRVKSHVSIRKILEHNASRSSDQNNIDTKRNKHTYLDISIQPEESLFDGSTASKESDLNLETIHGAMDDNEESDFGIITPSDFRFSPNFLPRAQQIIVCLADIDIPEVQKIISEPPKRTSCDAVDGWLSPGSVTTIRELMTQHLQRWLSEKSADGSRHTHR